MIVGSGVSTVSTNMMIKYHNQILHILRQATKLNPTICRFRLYYTFKEPRSSHNQIKDLDLNQSVGLAWYAQLSSATSECTLEWGVHNVYIS